MPDSLPDRIPFEKLHGAGNDFVVVDGRAAGAAAWDALARRLCDRHFGVGADGLLVAAAPSPRAGGAVAQMRMFNPDGSEAEMCGNGLRCFGRWLLDRGELNGREATVETGAGLLRVRIGTGGRIATTMGRPRLAPRDIPLSPAAAAGQPADGPVLRLSPAVAAPGPKGGGEGRPPADALADAPDVARSLALTCVSMGNPHAVAFVDDVAAFPLEVVGPWVERHPFFPARTNFEIVQVESDRRLRVRVWERGAGITLACGTGAAAAMVAARLHGIVGDRATLALPGGELEVEWPGGAAEVTLAGTAVHVFTGEWISQPEERKERSGPPGASGGTSGGQEDSGVARPSPVPA